MGEWAVMPLAVWVRAEWVEMAGRMQVQRVARPVNPRLEWLASSRICIVRMAKAHFQCADTDIVAIWDSGPNSEGFASKSRQLVRLLRPKARLVPDKAAIASTARNCVCVPFAAARVVLPNRGYGLAARLPRPDAQRSFPMTEPRVVTRPWCANTESCATNTPACNAPMARGRGILNSRALEKRPDGT
jgi:hypothetical protein